MNKSVVKSRTPKYNIENETNINDLLGGAKPKRGKKKSIADDFEDIGVPTTTIVEQVAPNKLTKANTVSTTKPTTKPTKANTVSTKPVAKKETETEQIEEEQVYEKNGYKRPEVTFTDQLSKEQIEEKLEDYKKVDDIFKVPLGVHLRYFSNINGKMVFRMGGLLHRNTGLPDYVILSTSPTGKPGWSVQVKDTLFYRKMTLQEIKIEYQSIIDELIGKNKKLKDENKKLNEKLVKYAK
jgi:hypothetical protein